MIVQSQFDINFTIANCDPQGVVIYFDTDVFMAMDVVWFLSLMPVLKIMMHILCDNF